MRSIKQPAARRVSMRSIAPTVIGREPPMPIHIQPLCSVAEVTGLAAAVGWATLESHDIREPAASSSRYREPKANARRTTLQHRNTRQRRRLMLCFQLINRLRQFVCPVCASNRTDTHARKRARTHSRARGKHTRSPFFSGS